MTAFDSAAFDTATFDSDAVRASYSLAVGCAALSMADGNVRLIVGRRVSVEPAMLALQGAGAALRVARRLGTTPAAFAVDGADVALIYQAAGSPDVGAPAITGLSLAMTGGDVRLRVDRRLPVVPVGVEIGGSARLLVGRRIPVAAAALLLGTGEVGARVARKFRINGAETNLAAGDVVLRYSAQVSYARAPSGPGYAPRQAERQSRPVQAGGERPSATQENYR